MEPSRNVMGKSAASPGMDRPIRKPFVPAALLVAVLFANVYAQTPAAKTPPQPPPATVPATGPAKSTTSPTTAAKGSEKSASASEKPAEAAKTVADNAKPVADNAKPVAEPTTPDRLAGVQQQVADKFKRLEDLLLRMAELSAQSDPRRAALLRKAVAQSKDRLVGPQFESIVELLRKDQLAPASDNQGAVQQDLRAMLELLLSENRSKQLESEKARLRDYLKRLATLINLQKSLQGRTAGEDKPSDLAPEQAKLAGKTGELANEIKTKEEGAAKSTPPAGGGNGKEPKAGKPSAKEPEAGKPSAKEPKAGKPSAKEPEAGKPSAKEPEAGKPSAKEPKAGDAKTPPSAAKESKPQAKPSTPQGKDNGKSGKDGSQGQSQSQGQGQPGDSQPPPSKDDGNPARKRLEAAAQRMREAEQKLHDAEKKGATEKQEEAIRELEKAKADLEEILRQLREEEIDRLLTMLDARFTKMLKLQREVLQGTVRLESVPAASRTHSHTIESGRLSSKEAEIDVEAEKAMLLLKEDGTAVAFPEAVQQLRGDIRQVVQRLSETKTEKMTQDIEEEIISQLEEMIKSLQKAKKDRERKKPKNSKPSNSESPTPPLVDALAELKMIRALQMRVNTRTQRYSTLIQGEQAQNPDLLDALKRLSERQQRIFKTTRDLDLGKNQ